MSKIQLVIVDEMMFGYIDPKFPNSISVLRGMVTRGWLLGDQPSIVNDSTRRNVRLATVHDFDVYRIAYPQYPIKDYEFINN